MQLSAQDIKLLLLGNETLPYGLLYCIGNKSKVDGSLRKSAYFSAELFLSFLEKHPQKIDFIKVFADLEDEEYKLLSLSTHVLADKKLQDKGLVAFKIIKYLKDERPHFNLDNVLEMKKLQDQFSNWYKSVRVQQIQEQIQQTTWKESDQAPPENLNLQREQNKRQKKLEHITLQSDGNPEYLIKTFYNPFVPSQRVTKSNKNRDAALKKKQVADSLNATVDVESVEQLKASIRNLDKVIVKIHLDSQQFDAPTFLKLVQPQITKQSMQYLIQQNVEMNKNIVYYFIDDFFCINQGILQIQNEFVAKEYKDSQKRKNTLAKQDQSSQPMQVDEILILGSLSKRTFSLLSKLNSISQTMNSLRTSQIQLKSVLDFLRKCEQYIQLPVLLKEAYMQRNNAQVMKLIQTHNLNQYKNISLFQKLNESIDAVIKQIYQDMLQQIKQQSQDYSQMQELCEYIIDLNVTQNCKEDIVSNLQQSIISNFNSYFRKSQKNETYQIESITGDFILEFLQQCSEPQNQQQLLNCKMIEIYVAGKFNTQVKQYQVLCKDLQLNANYNQIKTEIQSTLVEFFQKVEGSWFSQKFNQLLSQRIHQDTESIKVILATLNNLFGEMKTAENALSDIEIKAMSQEFTNYTLKQLKINFAIPQRDFFGINFSDYMLQLFNEILKISKNRNISGQMYLKLLQDSLNCVQLSCTTSSDYLVFLHNLKLISTQIKDLSQRVYGVSKQQISFKEFAEPIQQQINPLLSGFYQPTLQSYVKVLKFDQVQQMDIVPRPYIISWLITLNEQAVLLAQLNCDQLVTDSIISYIISLCFKNIEAVSSNAKKTKLLGQLNQEINLLKAMTTTFQGQVSQEGFVRLQRKLEEMSQGALSDVSEWVRQQKYKMSFNFKALYGYYQQQ